MCLTAVLMIEKQTNLYTKLKILQCKSRFPVTNYYLHYKPYVDTNNPIILSSIGCLFPNDELCHMQTLVIIFFFIFKLCAYPFEYPSKCTICVPALRIFSIYHVLQELPWLETDNHFFFYHK